MNIALIATLAKRLAAVCFVAVILWHLAPHSQTPRGKAIVYVTEPDVMVDIDGQRYHVASLAELPLVRELAAGLHAAVVWRGGKRIAAEQFLVEPGQDVVVRAAGRPGTDLAERRTSAAVTEARPPGLAVHF